MSLNIPELRDQFPSLHQDVNGHPAMFLDGPGGTQTPQRVIDAMSDYLKRDNSNKGGHFRTSQNTVALVRSARQAMADFYNASRPEEIVFGANMTTLTLNISRSIARTWTPGDEIILTHIDHFANVSPWLMAAEDRGVTVRWLDFEHHDCTLRLNDLDALLNERTQLVAINYASNAVGTISPVKKIVEKARQVGAWTYVDAVHLAPHDVIDVQALGCDFLVSSAYKYFGPHSGILYGKYEHLDQLTAYQVAPAPQTPPGKWETGTQSFETIAGIKAAVDYIAGLSSKPGSRRERVADAMRQIKDYEMALSQRFLEGIATVPGARVYGITDVERLDERTPTFGILLDGYTPEELAKRLGEVGIFVWDGHYYALDVIRRLGLLESGGMVRIGFAHYNTFEEVDRLVETLRELA